MQTDPTNEFEKQSNEFRSVDGIAPCLQNEHSTLKPTMIIRRQRLTIAAASAALVAIVWSLLPSDDLSAAAETPPSEVTGIRLQTPDFNSQFAETPMPGLQIVTRQSGPVSDGPVILSRQSSPKSSPPYSPDGLHSTTGLQTVASLVSQTTQVPGSAPQQQDAVPNTQPRQSSQPQSSQPQTAAPPADDRTETSPRPIVPTWSLKPNEQGSSRNNGANKHKPFPESGWSLLPDKHKSKKSKGVSDSRQPTAPSLGEDNAADVSPQAARPSPELTMSQPPAPTIPSETAPATPGATVPPNDGLSTGPMIQPRGSAGIRNPPAALEFELDRTEKPPVESAQTPAPSQLDMRLQIPNPSALTPEPVQQPSAPQQPLSERQLPFESPDAEPSIPMQFAPTAPMQHGVPPTTAPETVISPPLNGGHSFQQYDAPITNGAPTYAEASPYVGSETVILDDASAIPMQVGGHSIFGPLPGTSGFRATVEHDGLQWMSPYNARAELAGQNGVSPALVPQLSELPPGFRPWWDHNVRQPTGLAPSSATVEVGSLLQDALLYSPQVAAIQTEPEVQYRVITQEAARFDWTAFLETTYDDLNDPVGNELTTGNGQDRLLIRKLRSEAGLRQKNLNGGEFRIAQQLGHENQNSRFFIPNNQGTSRLELSYRQPLLDGAGRSYNESDIVLARIQANSSEDEVVGALQDHLIEVTKAYWTLHRARAEFFQRQKLLMSAQHVLARLEGRTQVDTIPRQVLRARAAVARSQTRIQRTIARVKDAEAQLRLLVNSPNMVNGGPVELTPIEPPSSVTETADLRSVLQTALLNRSDISEAIRQMRAAAVRLGVSRTELLPKLDFLLETYIADLAGSSDIGRALRGQYTDNRPGYTVGFEFEFPIENRAARARMEQRQWEMKRAVSVFRATVEKSLTDVEIADREVATAHSEMLSRYQSMMAAKDEASYLQDRFEVLPASEDSATLLLEDLLDSYERLADEEAAFVQAQVDHAIAIVALKKEVGILLQSRHSPPQIQAAEQQWIDNRLESAFDAKGPKRPQERDAAVAAGAHSMQEAGNVNQRSLVAPTVSADGTVRPMPLHPTTWARPAGQRSTGQRK